MDEEYEVAVVEMSPLSRHARGAGVKERLYKVRPTCGGPWCVMGARELLALFEKEADVDEQYEVAVVEMSRAEQDALPEFSGW